MQRPQSPAAGLDADWPWKRAQRGKQCGTSAAATDDDCRAYNDPAIFPACIGQRCQMIVRGFLAEMEPGE
jgi:hypothetical protein